MESMSQAKWFYWLIAIVSLLLGLIGIVLPLLPTTPFIILALWAAGKCSPRLSRYLETHPRLGPILRNWHENQAIPLGAKWLASGMMISSFVILWYRGTSAMVLFFMFFFDSRLDDLHSEQAIKIITADFLAPATITRTKQHLIVLGHLPG